jgi:predicted tellurium resistance membrane protein TerC
MEFLTAENIIALISLSALEIVLGIDNIIFISIIASKLPASQQDLGRSMGLGVALVMRIGLLLAITWIMRLTEPLFAVMSQSFSGRDIILLVGGLFLIGKATYEIHDKFEAHTSKEEPRVVSFASAIVQIALLDIVFSLDSVITAVGMVSNIGIMIAAIIIAIIVMLFFAKSISAFIERHPTFKMLALSFLLLIGVMLVADGLGQHISKGYVYFALGFSLLVECLNMKLRKPAVS